MTLIYDQETESYADINENIFTKNHFPMLVIDDISPVKTLRENKIIAGL